VPDWGRLARHSACASKPSEEPLEQYLAEVEMKLQLLAEDIAVSLEDHSTHAMQRMPRALAEVRIIVRVHPPCPPVEPTRDRLCV